MKTIDDVLKEMQSGASDKVKVMQQYFGVKEVNSLGLTTPQLRNLARQIGTNHALALELWNTGIHEAMHVATMIADPAKTDEKLMEKWLKDFNSWDIVDGCCSSLFRKTPLAYEKAVEWANRKKEYEKRAGFTMMAQLAVHDKKAPDKKMEPFFPLIISASTDDRNFVKKAVNWALRQIGKRNERLCKKAITCAKKIHAKGDATSGWIASDALRELQRYQQEGKIKNVGTGK